MLVKSHITKISRYSPPWSHLNRAEYLRFDLNENTQNLPSHVVAALKDFVGQNRIQMYPEYKHFLLKLSQYVKIDNDYIMLTNGSDQAIEIVLRAFLGTDDTMVIAQPEFPIFTQVAKLIDAKVCGVPYDKNQSFPYNDFINSISSKTGIVVIINPNNPTGTAIPLIQIQKILEKNHDVPVLVDEAYFEFTETTALNFLKIHHNLLIIRTFSKAFAMAGLRLGYIIAHPEIISQLHKMRGPFDVNSCALIAAEAQIDFPDAWKRYVHEAMNIAKPCLENFFSEYGIRYYPGAAHFMLVQPEDRDHAVQYLKNHGILVRPMTATPINNTFRMNVGTVEQTKKFIEIYKMYLHNLKNERANS